MRFLPQAALLFSSLIAAGTFLIAKETTQRFTPIELSWFRIMLSFVIVLPLYRLLRRDPPRPGRTDVIRLLLLGLMGVTANQILFLHGIHLAPPIDGALMYAFTPGMVLLAGVAFLGERLSLKRFAGAGVAFVGVVIILRARGLALSMEYLTGDLILLMAVLAWTGYTLLGKSVLRCYDTFTVITWAFGFGALSLLPASPFILADMDFSRPGWEGWLGLFYLSAATSGVAFTLWYWALRRLEASQVAIFTNLQPPLTAFLAWWFLGEIPGWRIIGGGLLVLTGVTLAQWPATTTAPTRQPQ